MQDKLKALKKDMVVVKSIMLINSIMICFFIIWSFIKPARIESTVTANGGNAAANVSINSDHLDMIEKAKKRGYFTAKEYAEFEGIDRETVYRRLDAGLIPNAEKVNKRWRITYR